jgi:hypothetical protein
MDPTSNLEDATEYEVRVVGGSSGVKDLAGNPLPGDVVWRFTTLAASGDPFGVKKIYPTRSGGEEWYMDMANPLGDPRFGPIPSTITKNPDGSWKISGTQIRLHVFTSTGYDKNKISTYDQQQLASKGYMQASNDWKNVEMTGYLKVISTNSSVSSIDWYARGRMHTSTSPCEGVAYHAGLKVDGTAFWQKEIWHTGGYTDFRDKVNATHPILGRWIGFKAIMYNTNNDSAVEMQTYLDDNATNHWRKVMDTIDNGGWYANPANDLFYSADCGRSKDYVILNAGPIATFRSDNIIWDFKDLSIREIHPQSQ